MRHQLDKRRSSDNGRRAGACPDYRERIQRGIERRNRYKSTPAILESTGKFHLAATVPGYRRFLVVELPRQTQGC